jgi:hypothetical protein
LAAGNPDRRRRWSRVKPCSGGCGRCRGRHRSQTRSSDRRRERRWRAAGAVAVGASGAVVPLADAALGSQRTRFGQPRRPPDSVSTEAWRRADPFAGFGRRARERAALPEAWCLRRADAGFGQLRRCNGTRHRRRRTGSDPHASRGWWAPKVPRQGRAGRWRTVASAADAARGTHRGTRRHQVRHRRASSFDCPRADGRCCTPVTLWTFADSSRYLPGAELPDRSGRSWNGRKHMRGGDGKPCPLRGRLHPGAPSGTKTLTGRWLYTR